MISELEIRRIEAGWYGVEEIADPSAHTNGPYAALFCTAATVVAEIKSDMIASGVLAAHPLPAGSILRLPRMTSITLTSGKCIAFKQGNVLLH